MNLLVQLQLQDNGLRAMDVASVAVGSDRTSRARGRASSAARTSQE